MQFLKGIALIMCVATGSIVKANALPVEMKLDRGWQFLFNEKWYDTAVPNSIHTALLNHNLVPDPFFSDNEKKLQWIGDQEWIFRNEFIAGNDMIKKHYVVFCFKGLDTYADVYLNSQRILQADNMFREWEVAVNALLQAGKNELKIIFHPAGKRAKELYDRYEIKNLPGEERVMVRKAQYHFGWDFAPRFITCGITNSIILKGWDDFIPSNFSVLTDSLSRHRAYLSGVVEINSETSLPLRFKLTDKKTGKLITAFHTHSNEGKHEIKFPIVVSSPELWWCNGSGNPALYTFLLEISTGKNKSHFVQTTTGIRTIRLVRQPDNSGESFYFELNGKPVYMKGANYVPQDVFADRVADEQYRQLLLNVKDANMNMLRVWGGGLYEKDVFYNLCDSLGILVWQDFMFACGMYPFDKPFLENIEAEAEQQVKRLRHHPCMALWCGNNEISEGWQRWGWPESYTQPERETLEAGYKIIFSGILPASVKNFSNSDYLESSPVFGRGDVRHTTQGDAHNWFVWHDGEPFENYEQNVPRFMSEFGFQSLPDMKTIRSFCSDSILSVESPCIQSHQKHGRGFKIIQSYMERYDATIPMNFDEYAKRSQQIQAMGIGKGINAQMLSQPRCMGSLVWQLNDCWPGITWSMLDYYGRKKDLYFEVKELFRVKD